MLKLQPVPGDALAGADHPLIRATIDTLPAVGQAFTAARRKAALDMIAMAFNVVYGPGDAVQIEDETPAPPARPQLAVMQPAPARPLHLQNGCDYYVDAEGYARCDTLTPRRRVLAEEAKGQEIYEYRRGVLRDRETVIWSDETMGALPGMSFCGPG